MISAEHRITVPVAVLSILITILSIIISIFLISHLYTNCLNDQHDDNVDAKKKTVINYFKYSASIIIIFNSLSSLFVTIYCVHLILYPYYNDNTLLIDHSSHYHRIIATSCWYISKVALIWFFNGRLYYAFIGSSFTVKKVFFITINVIITIIAPLTIICAYSAIYNETPLFAEIAFNSFWIIYEILTFILLYMFSKRLLLLTIHDQSLSMLQTKPNHQVINSGSPETDKKNSCIIHTFDGIDGTATKKKGVSFPKLSNTISSEIKKISFMEVTTRNAVLVLAISISVAFVSVAFTSFRFIFLSHTRLTLLIPLNISTIDSLISSISIICLFNVGDKIYQSLCDRSHQCFKRICIYFARKYLNNME